MKIVLPIERLAKLIEDYKKIKLLDHEEISIDDLGLQVPTPAGLAPVNEFIKKENLPVMKITLSNGYSFIAATTHIVRSNNSDRYLKDLKIGNSVDHRISRNVVVTDIEYIATADCYDIAIPVPNIYYDANGVLHHNTITTATLSKICEKYGRTITIVPNKDLVVQTEEDFINCGLDVGVYFGDRKDLGRTHTVCTWQSLNILDKKSLNARDEDELLTLAELLDGVQTVMVDECFDEDSKVLTPKGYVEIKNIKPGDSVINYSENTKEFKIDTVVAQHKNLTNSSTEKMYQLVFDNDSVINVTGNHKFLTKDGWIRADQLTENHEIISSNMNTHI